MLMFMKELIVLNNAAYIRIIVTYCVREEFSPLVYI